MTNEISTTIKQSNGNGEFFTETMKKAIFWVTVITTYVGAFTALVVAMEELSKGFDKDNWVGAAIVFTIAFQG